MGLVGTSATSPSARAYYTPWGEPTWSAAAPALGFQGQRTDPATGQVDMTTRNYFPGLGRFTSRDVVSGSPTDPLSLNQFAYVGGNPISYGDPSGLFKGNLTTMLGGGVVVGGSGGAAVEATIAAGIVAASSIVLSDITLPPISVFPEHPNGPSVTTFPDSAVPTTCCQTTPTDIDTSIPGFRGELTGATVLTFPRNESGVGSTVMLTGGAYSVRKGQAGVEYAARVLRGMGFEEVATEVTIKTSEGIMRVDLVMKRDGQLHFLEIKNGPKARATADQLAKWEAFLVSGGIVMTDRLEREGLVRGSEIGPGHVINRQNVRNQEPDVGTSSQQQADVF